MKKVERTIASVCIPLLMLGLLAGCAQKPSDNETKPPFSVSIMTITHSGEPMPEDSPVKKELEKYTNTKIDFMWVPNSTYEDKLNITLASKELPTIITVDQKTASIINAARAGLFWEIGPYLSQYPNLSQADPQILKNSSIDGKVYGVYRSRPVGRNGITYRKDWFDQLGLQKLDTIDDFYQMLKAFTYGDPDGNGKQDTYGLAMSKYSGPWDIMSIWFGAPNSWGMDSKGNLIPAHTTKEYKDALDFFRQLYQEDLVNRDFPVLESSVWLNDIESGKAGVVVDVLDHAQRLQELSDRRERGQQYDVVKAVAGPQGLRNLPTPGYLGFHVIPKAGAKTEDEMKRTLQFLDQLNDKEMQILLNNGIENRHFKLEDGYAIPYHLDDIQLQREKQGLNQIHMGIPKDLSYIVKNNPIRDKIQRLVEENKSIVVSNPAESLTSDIWAQKGTLLDELLEDARVKYIVGQIDEEGLNKAYEQWEKNGGAELRKEINDLYKDQN